MNPFMSKLVLGVVFDYSALGEHWEPIDQYFSKVEFEWREVSNGSSDVSGDGVKILWPDNIQWTSATLEIPADILWSLFPSTYPTQLRFRCDVSFFGKNNSDTVAHVVSLEQHVIIHASVEAWRRVDYR